MGARRVHLAVSTSLFLLALLASMLAARPSAWAADEGVAEVAAYGSSAYAVKRDGSLWAWGDNVWGRLGVGDTQDRHSPVEVMDGVAGVEAGDHSAYAVKRDGSLWAWGYNGDGRLGIGDTDDHRRSPVKVMDGVEGVEAVGSYGHASVYAVKRDGSLWAWGVNDSGQLGVGDAENRHSPVKVMDGVAEVEAGGSSAYAVKRDGSLWAWGDNNRGELGIGDTDDRHSPVKVMDGVERVAASGDSAYAVKRDGSLWAWGYNSNGELGVGDTEERHGPVEVMDGVERVTASGNSAYAVKRDGSLWAWGVNEYGQLGVGDTDDRRTPVEVMDGVEGVEADVYAVGSSAYAVKRDGSLWAWGDNGYGQLGVGDFEDRPSPVEVMDGVEGVEADAGGLSFSAYAVKRDGSLWAWGDNNRGELGIGDTDDRPSPVEVMDGGGFADVPASHWVYAEGWLQYVTSHKLMGGYDGSFAPEGDLTRGQVAAILYRIANPGSDATTNPEHYGEDTGFKDGGSQRYYFAAVRWMKEKKIATGDRNPDGSDRGTFRPDADITRQELTVMVFRFSQIMGAKASGAGASALGGYRDGPAVQPYAREAMAWCLANGVVSGYGGNLAPAANATRAQAAKIFTVVHRDVLKK